VLAATRTIAFVFSPARSGRALRRPRNGAAWRGEDGWGRAVRPSGVRRAGACLAWPGSNTPRFTDCYRWSSVAGVISRGSAAFLQRPAKRHSSGRSGDHLNLPRPDKPRLGPRCPRAHDRTPRVVLSQSSRRVRSTASFPACGELRERLQSGDADLRWQPNARERFCSRGEPSRGDGWDRRSPLAPSVSRGLDADVLGGRRVKHRRMRRVGGAARSGTSRSPAHDGESQVPVVVDRRGPAEVVVVEMGGAGERECLRIW
jgi:hypothetical protein